MNDQTPQEESKPEHLEEDLAPEPEAPKEPVVSKWDVLTVVILILVGGGFWLWYSSAKNDSSDHFHVADSLYASGNLPEALKAYRSLRSSEAIIAKQDDSLMYLRMDSLEAFEERDLQLANGARAALTSEDSTLIRAATDAVKSQNHGFVPRSLLDSLHL